MKLNKGLLSAVLLLWSAAVFAAPGAGSPGGSPGDMRTMPPPGQTDGGPGMQPNILGFAAELDLNSAQVEKLIAIQKASSLKTKKSQEEMRTLMEQMRIEADKDSPDNVKVGAIIDKLAENHKNFLKERFLDMQQIKAVLTKEQQKKMKKLMPPRPDESHGKRP